MIPFLHMTTHTPRLVDAYPIISDQITKPRLGVVLSELEKILQSDTPGDIVEFGCYIGTTSLFIRRLLDQYDSEKQFHVYDSFEGLPPKVQQDNSPVGDDFKAGELTISKKQLLEQFHKARLQLPIVHKGWFRDLSLTDVPEQIAFAFLDGDFYDSIIDSLRLVWPRMQKGGIITIDDYGREALPGVERAVRDFFQDKPIRIRAVQDIAVLDRI
jgi:O-methyltransferase